MGMELFKEVWDMKTFFRLLGSALLGVVIGTTISVSLGFYDHKLWEHSEIDIRDQLINRANVLSVDDGIVLDHIATCMAEMYVHFAIVRECDYDILRPIKENIVICTTDNLTVGDLAMVESCIVKVLGPEDEFEGTL